MPRSIAGIVLAAGKGTRMKSERAKVLHPILGRPLAWYPVTSAFELGAQQVVAVVGPSGAGKTTLASLLPRFWDVDQGAIRLDGIDIRDLTLADLRHAIGIVPQEPALFSGTVRENIAYARPDASAEDVEAAAQAGEHSVDLSGLRL